MESAELTLIPAALTTSPRLSDEESSPRIVSEVHPQAAARVGAYLHAIGVVDAVIRAEHTERILGEIEDRRGRLDTDEFVREAAAEAIQIVGDWVDRLIAASPFRDRVGGTSARGLVLTQLRPLLRERPDLLLAPITDDSALRRAVDQSAAVMLPIQSRCQMKPQPFNTPGDGRGMRRFRVRAAGLWNRRPGLEDIPVLRRMGRPDGGTEA